MYKKLNGLVIIGITSLMFVGCAEKQTFEQVMYGKTAEESASMIAKETKFPHVVNKNLTLVNVQIDSNDKKIVIWTYESKLLPKSGEENVFFNQEKCLENEAIKKKIIYNCKNMYSYYQNGAKMRVISKWANGNPFEEYLVDKSVCDDLN